MLVWAIAMAVALSVWPHAATAAATPRYQAIWVDAFHEGFKTPEQTRQLIAWSRRHNINALFVEVRKAGDAYYRSKIEPTASDISPQGYDPLADLIRLAHDTRGGRQRIEIHAWLIVYRVGLGKPLSSTHIARRRAEWLSRTHGGQTSEEGNTYLDPGVPEVINHTAHVVADLVSSYDLDGIHFDRIRYPSRQWGYNATAVSRYRRIYRRVLKPRSNDTAWSQFRREQVDAMLRQLYITAKARRPAIKVSAATIAFDDCGSDFRKTRAYSDALQDWRSWVRQGWLDLNLLMDYKRDAVAKQALQYRQWLQFLAYNRGWALPVVGQGSFLNSPSGSLRQISLAQQHKGIAGVCLFSYAQLVREGDRPELLTNGLRQRYFRAGVPAPSLPPPDRSGYGWIAGSVIGKKRDYVPVALSTDSRQSTRTDGSGFFAFTRVPPGEYSVTATLGRGRTAVQKIRVNAGKVAWARLEP